MLVSWPTGGGRVGDAEGAGTPQDQAEYSIHQLLVHRLCSAKQDWEASE